MLPPPLLIAFRHNDWLTVSDLDIIVTMIMQLSDTSLRILMILD